MVGDKMGFELLPGETIILTKRRHWFRLFTEIASLFIGLIIFIAFYILAINYFNIVNPLYIKLMTLGLILVTQACFISLAIILVDYLLDVWLITNRRVFFVEVLGLFSRTTSSIDYDRIEDISVEINGIIETVLNFGDVHIETAGAFRPFLCKDISEPEVFKDTIFNLKSDKIKRENAGL